MSQKWVKNTDTMKIHKLSERSTLTQCSKHNIIYVREKVQLKRRILLSRRINRLSTSVCQAFHGNISIQAKSHKERGSTEDT